MKTANILKDDSAVAISIGFILMFGVTVVVFSTIVLSFYDLTEEVKEDAMRESYRMLGNKLSTKITIVDTIINITKFYGGTVNLLEYEFTAPASIASETYSFNITDTTNEVIIESDITRTVTPFNISTNLNSRKLYSGAENYKFTYNTSNDIINIEEI